MAHLESIKDDNTKYFYILRYLQNNNSNKKTSIIVKDKEGNCPGSTTDTIKIIEEYFKETLAPKEMEDEFMAIPPCEMKSKFTAKEIKKLAQRMNNNKASGPDQQDPDHSHPAKDPGPSRYQDT